MSGAPADQPDLSLSGADPAADLLALYASGDPGAARALAESLLPRVLAQANRMLGDAAEAEDVAQEAMLRLWRAAPGWRREGGRVSTWLYRVVANLCTDRLRRRRSLPLDDAAEPPDPAPAPLSRMEEADRLRALSDALARLPERQAQAVALRHLEGLSNPEIAEAMDIGVEAVESLTARGRRALAAILGSRRSELGYEE